MRVIKIVISDFENIFEFTIFMWFEGPSVDLYSNEYSRGFMRLLRSIELIHTFIDPYTFLQSPQAESTAMKSACFIERTRMWRLCKKGN